MPTVPNPENARGVELSSTSIILLRDMRSQSSGSWTTMIDTYAPRVYRRCRDCGLDVQDAEDVTQEVFAAVARSIAAFERRPGTGGFSGWLSVITGNKLKDFWRQKMRTPLADGGTTWHKQILAIEDELESSSEDGIGWDEDSRLELISTIRAETSERDWTIFERVVIEERAVEEVAREFAVTPNVIYLIRSRTIRKIKDHRKHKAL